MLQFIKIRAFELNRIDFENFVEKIDFDLSLEDFELGSPVLHSRTLNKGNNRIAEQSSKRKVKTRKYTNRQNQSTTGKP